MTGTPERFVMTVHSTPQCWMNVVVYDTTAEMQAASLRHRPASDPVSLAESGGCFQAANSGHPTYLGIVRFSREFLTPAAVIHESVHAALVYVQKKLDVNRLQMDAWSDGARTIENEEELAYSVHGIASSLLSHFDLVTA
jgi:hypothetical protein